MAVYETQSASSASNDPASVVAVTPTGPSPHSSPASRPSLPELWTHSPTSSSSGWPMIPRNAYRPNRLGCRDPTGCDQGTVGHRRDELNEDEQRKRIVVVLRERALVAPGFGALEDEGVDVGRQRQLCLGWRGDSRPDKDPELLQVVDDLALRAAEGERDD